MVLETRTKINGHLDKLQKKLLQQLRSSSDTCKSKYLKILQKFRSSEEMLTQLREQTIHMKQFSSDLQVFLGTRQTNKQVGSEVESIKTEFEATKNYELKVSFHSVITKLSNEVDEFGKIMVSESATNFDFRDPKFEQAQMKINVQTSRSISDIKLQLIKSFQIKSKNEMSVIACIILPNRNLLIANTKDNHLIEYSDTGKLIRDIPVSSQPYGITVIDPDRIVVTYGDTSYIEIMNNENFNVENNFRLPKNCWGVSHANGKLYVVYGDSIQVLDVSGRQMKTRETASKRISRINVAREKIIYSDWEKKKVYCCQMNGKELWQFENKSMNFPKGLTVDNYQNVFVVGGLFENLTIIQNDESASKTLLTNLDGLRFPSDVYYDKVTHALLICNEKGMVSLYKVL
ncbi:uncharacterized protein LOC134701242 [Mytilus trossulus]|uniref:uncharacterized protein LOC134701242 n=1 Tax=Mytilus trossulus TaxID=6551 RepID=UPI0030051ABC